MPNNGHRWTEEEERAAVLFGVYEEFVLLYPNITRDAHRLRRAALIRANQPKPNRLRALVHRLVCG